MLAEVDSAARFLAAAVLPYPPPRIASQDSAAAEAVVEESSSTGDDDASDVRQLLIASIARQLSAKYTGHWHADDPEQGSAYRCLEQRGPYLDSIILQALQEATCAHPTLAHKDVLDALATSLGSSRWTLWVDPGCVSVRFHEGPICPPLLESLGMNGSIPVKTPVGFIRELYGKLGAGVLAVAQSSSSTNTAVSAGPPAMATPSAERGAKTSFLAVVTASDFSPAASPSPSSSNPMAEFAEIIREVNASPIKRSKAIAIIRPASSVVAPIAAEPVEVTRVATPPPFLPPLEFTIEESTSPYVPSFATHAASTSTTPTPVPTAGASPSPLGAAADGAATTPSLEQQDVFARPSSRSSTTSAGSNASCSIFSHSSHESRSSSIASFSTMASSTSPALSAASLVAKATAQEVSQAAMFTFPHGGHPTGLVPMHQHHPRSAPASPSKPRRHGARHQHTSSTASNIVAGTTAASAPTSAAGHSRGRSSQSNIRVSTVAGQVQDYSNGKVGVLGGGVLLGLGGGARNNNNNTDKRRSGSSASGSNAEHGASQRRPASANSNSSGSSTTLGAGSESRQRSKSRTPSSSSSHNGHHGNKAMPASWYAAHQYHPVPPISQHWMHGQV